MLRRVEVQHYTLREEWAAAVGRADDRDDVGVVAQQVAMLWPDAVRISRITNMPPLCAIQ